MNKRIKWLRLAFTGVVLVLCALALRGVDLPVLGGLLRRARVPVLLLAVAANFAAIFGRSQRWRAVVAPVARLPRSPFFLYLNIGYAASIVLPAQGGEGVRLYLLRERHGVPLATSLGMLLVERLFDLIGLVACAAPLPWLLPLSSGVRAAILACSVCGVVALAAAVGLGLYMAARGPAASPEPSTEGSFLLRLGAGLSGVGRSALWPPALFWTLFAWASDALTVWLALRALSLPNHLPWATPLLVLLTVTLAVVVPGAPGNLGTLEAGAVAGVHGVGVAAAPALAFAILYHMIQILPVMLAGLLAFLLLRPTPPTIAPKPESQS